MARVDRKQFQRTQKAFEAANDARSAVVEAMVDGRSKETIARLEREAKIARDELYRAERNL